MSSIRTTARRRAVVAILTASIASLLSTATVFAGGGSIPWPK